MNILALNIFMSLSTEAPVTHEAPCDHWCFTHDKYITAGPQYIEQIAPPAQSRSVPITSLQ